MGSMCKGHFIECCSGHLFSGNTKYAFHFLLTICEHKNECKQVFQKNKERNIIRTATKRTEVSLIHFVLLHNKVT